MLILHYKKFCFTKLEEKFVNELLHKLYKYELVVDYEYREIYHF